MASTIFIPAPSGIGTIRIRDRRRTRRPPTGAMSLSGETLHYPNNIPEPRTRSRPTWLNSDDVRQFAMSFAAFFTAAMIFLA